MSPEVKNIFTFRKPKHDFLSNLFWHFLSISYRFRNIRLQIFGVWPWPLTFRDHLKSKIFSHFHYSPEISRERYERERDSLSLSLSLVPLSRKFGSKFWGSQERADFYLFKVTFIDRYFSISRNGLTLAKRRSFVQQSMWSIRANERLYRFMKNNINSWRHLVLTSFFSFPDDWC